MTQQNTTLSTLQLKAIDQLLQGKSVVATSRSVGVNRSTLYDWLATEAFASELDRQRRHLAGDISRRVMSLCAQACNVLRLGMQGKAKGWQIRAATNTLTLYVNITRTQDMAVEIDELRRQLNEIV